LKKENVAHKTVVVVLGGSSAGALGVIRDLSKHDIPVYAVESDRKQVFIYSKYCKKFICPNAKNHEQAYIDFLVNIGKTFKTKAVLMPTGDIESRAILKHKDELISYFHFISSDIEISDILLNKSRFYKFLEKCDIAHPKTYFPDSSSSLEEICENMIFPCILKPVFSARFTSDFKKKAFIAKSKEELINHYNLAKEKNHEIIIQEIIPGDASNMIGLNAYYNEKSEPLGVFIHRRIRQWPADFGNGCFIEHIYQEDIENIVNSLIKKIKYHGIVDAEFKKDPRDNIYKLIEINSRAWMQISYPNAYGMNIAYQSYLSSIGKNIQINMETKKNNNIKWLYFFYDIRASLHLIKHGKLSIKDWIDSYKCKKKYGIFARDDPLPFLVLLLLSIFHLLFYPFIKNS